jgi:hypothetical protein
MTTTKTPEDGPAQVFATPATLVGHVVDWRDGGAIQGIAVDDLSRHYAPHEVLLLGLTGEEISVTEGRAFAVAMTWISAAGVGTGPTHAAVLARVSGAPTSGLVGTAALVAAREAGHELEVHAGLLAWLNGARREPFAGWHTRDRHWRQRLAHACEVDLPDLELARDLGSAALIVFHHVGLRQPAQLIAAWAWARMIGSLSEGLAESGLDIHTYPLRLPHFDYEEDR